MDWILWKIIKKLFKICFNKRIVRLVKVGQEMKFYQLLSWMLSNKNNSWIEELKYKHHQVILIWTSLASRYMICRATYLIKKAIQMHLLSRVLKKYRTRLMEKEWRLWAKTVSISKIRSSWSKSYHSSRLVEREASAKKGTLIMLRIT